MTVKRDFTGRFPRTVSQAESLANYMKQKALNWTLVLSIEVDKRILLKDSQEGEHASNVVQLFI